MNAPQYTFALGTLVNVTVLLAQAWLPALSVALAVSV
jgi:hypothetical protein